MGRWQRADEVPLPDDAPRSLGAGAAGRYYNLPVHEVMALSNQTEESVNLVI